MKKLMKVLSLFLICVVTVMSLPSTSFAATLGESLSSPEDGWQRYNYDCGKIDYYGGTWRFDSAYSKSYVSPYTVIGTGFKFKFRGTKFRIIGAKWVTFSDNITVKIDGENIDTVSFYSASSLKAPLLMYEKTGLDNEEHEVEFINNSATSRSYLAISALDIDDTGTLLDYDAIISLTATTNESAITLNWDAVKSATNYNIYRSTTKDGPYDTVYSTSTTNSFTDTEAKTGTTYYYVVRAIVADTEKENSNEASATIGTETDTSNLLKVVAEVNETIQLSVNDNLSSNTSMSWASSDEAVATVDSQGVVTGVAPGNAVITVTNSDGTYSDTINILVIESELELAIDINVGNTRRLTVDDLADTANATWSSGDEAIVTVDSKGKVTAVAVGTTYITVNDDQGNEIGKIYIRVRN